MSAPVRALSPRCVVPATAGSLRQVYRVCRKCHDALHRNKNVPQWACATGFLIGKFPPGLEHLESMTIAEVAACALVHLKGRVQVVISSKVAARCSWWATP